MTGAGVSGLRAFAARAADRGSGWQPSREMLEEMAAAQDHRGGGGTDVWLARGVGLARSRSHAADDPVPQPARSADGRWVVALDGTLRDQASLRAHLGHLRSRDDGELVAAGLAWEGISFVERLTYPLMQLFGYEPFTDVSESIPEVLLWDPPHVTPDQLTEWIRPHVRVDEVSTAVEMGKEILRMRLLARPRRASQGRPELIDSLFYSPALFEACRANLSVASPKKHPRRPVRRRLLAEAES